MATFYPRLSIACGRTIQSTSGPVRRLWVAERGGTPACVKGTGGGRAPGRIRIDFPGWSGEESLQPISWDAWFKAFDDNKLAFLYQDTSKGGQESRFNKLVSRS